MVRYYEDKKSSNLGGKKMEKEKLLPAHKRAIELLKEDPMHHYNTLTAMYQGTIVPKEDIPELLEAFSKARDRIVVKNEIALEEVL